MGKKFLDYFLAAKSFEGNVKVADNLHSSNLSYLPFIKLFFMPRSRIAGIGMYVPEQVVTNHDLTKYMDTSDEWIRERTGIVERRYAHRTKETTTTMAIEAASIAIKRAGITPQDIDFIVFATLSPDYYFPGCGVLLQRAMKMNEIGALDVRNQCSGFVCAEKKFFTTSLT